MKPKLTVVTVLLVFGLIFHGLPANGADESFEYTDGPTGGTFGTILYYEVAKDYTIDIKEYLSDLSKLPNSYFKWDKTEEQRLILLQHINIVSAQLISWKNMGRC